MKHIDLSPRPVVPEIKISSPCTHTLQLWEDESFLTAAVTNFMREGFLSGQGVVIIATREHLGAFEAQLAISMTNLQALIHDGQLILLDAHETLATFMVDGKPNPEKFRAKIGALVDGLNRRFKGVRAYGEMVSILWQDGNKEATLALEHLWNELARTKTFNLLCGYSLNQFDDANHLHCLTEICQAHNGLHPTEDFLRAKGSAEGLESFIQLQQQAKSLKLELKRKEEAETALRKSEKHLSDFFDNAVMGLHWVDRNGVIVKANRAELDLLGYSAEEYIGKHVSDFHADAETIELILHKLTHNQTIKDFPARLRCKDGSIKNVLIDSNALFEDGKFVHTRCFTRDVTERVRFEDELKVALQARDEFLSIASHELKTPITSLHLQLGLRNRALMKEELSWFTEDRIHQMVSHDTRQVRRLMRLIDDMLDISRIQTGKFTLQKTEFDLGDLIGDSIERYQLEMKKSDCEIDYRRGTSLTGTWDMDRLEQVFTNLLSNALKYGAGHPIRVDAYRSEDTAVIEVHDKGIGIREEDMVRIFEKFERGISSEKISGFGLGLYISNKIIQEHGGTIDVRSQPGEGSVFTVKIPFS